MRSVGTTTKKTKKTRWYTLRYSSIQLFFFFSLFFSLFFSFFFLSFFQFIYSFCLQFIFVLVLVQSNQTEHKNCFETIYRVFIGPRFLFLSFFWVYSFPSFFFNPTNNVIIVLKPLLMFLLVHLELLLFTLFFSLFCLVFSLFFCFFFSFIFFFGSLLLCDRSSYLCDFGLWHFIN